MKKVFSVLLALLVTAPVLAQSWGPLTLPQPTAADDLKYVRWNATTRRYQLSTVAVSADNVIGNEVTNATDATLTRSGSGTAGSPYTLGLNLGNANTWTAAVSVLRAGITTTLMDGLALTNTTASTSGVPVQQSPALRWEGRSWSTSGAGNDDRFDWYQYMLPVTATTTTSSIVWASSKNSGAAAERMSLSSSGSLSLSGSLTLTATGSITGNTLKSGSLSTLTIQNTNLSTADRFLVNMGAGTLSQTLGTNGVLSITPTYNQTSGSASNTDLLINRTETAVGSGAQYLIDARVGGVSRFNVDNRGRTTARNYMISLIADAVVQMGQVVMPDAGTDNRFDVLTADSTLGIGVLSGVGPSAAGTAYNIAVDGIAYVAPAEDQAITRGQHLCVSGTEAGVVTSSAGICAQGKTIGKALYSEPVTYVIDPAGCGSSCVNTTSETITLSSAPGWAVNDPVIYYNSGGTSIGGLTDGATYWVRSISGADVTLKALKTDTAAINLTSAGDDATQYLIRLPQAIINVQ